MSLSGALSGVAVVLMAALVGGCGSTSKHYSADKFKRCMERQHRTVTLTRDERTASTAALVWRPAFAEWVYFFKTPEAARAEIAKLKLRHGDHWVVLSRLLRTRRSNAVVFAPAKVDWLTPIKDCLDSSRV
jgi:hypothetical protein